MKIRLNRNVLEENINLVKKAVSAKTNLPILEHILLTADNVGFRMLANDLKLAILTKDIDAVIDEKGIVAIDAKMLEDVVKKLPEGELTLSVDSEYVVTIESGKIKLSFRAIEGDDFPSIPEVQEETKISIKFAALEELVRKTIFSVAQEESKPVLTGELFEINDGKLNVVAVDGFRISVGTEEIISENNVSMVIPAKSLKEITKIPVSDKEQNIDIYLNEKNIKFVVENGIVVSRLLDGEYIKYNQLFAGSHSLEVKVDKAMLKSSLERTELISREVKRSPVKLQMTEDKIIITSNTDSGNFYEEINAEIIGEGIEIGFNPKYLLDVLKVIDDEKVVINFNNSLSPCIIKEESNSNYKYLVLPLRI